MNNPIGRFQLIALLFVTSLLNSACAIDSHGFDTVARFEEIPVSFSHNWDETVHPFSGAAVIDTDGDGKMEVFVGGSNN